MDLLVIGVITAVLFYILAIVCDEFFVPSIDILSNKLKLSSDVAGATLLAVGSSAPELFASTIAVFGLAGGGEDISDVGAGTIVGSAIFNVLVIIGVSAMFKAVKLQWIPVIRDLAFYVFTILLLLVAFNDGKVRFIEASYFLGAYLLYIFATLMWRKWFTYEDVQISESFIKVEPKGIT